MNISYEGRRFIGFYKYCGELLGSFYEMVEEPLSEILVIPFAIKTAVIDNELEAEQMKHFGPAIKHVPQVILNLQEVKYVRSKIDKSPIYVVNLKYFLDRSIVYREGVSNIFGIQFFLSIW